MLANMTARINFSSFSSERLSWINVPPGARDKGQPLRFSLTDGDSDGRGTC